MPMIASRVSRDLVTTRSDPPRDAVRAIASAASSAAAAASARAARHRVDRRDRICGVEVERGDPGRSPAIRDPQPDPRLRVAGRARIRRRVHGVQQCRAQLVGRRQLCPLSQSTSS